MIALDLDAQNALGLHFGLDLRSAHALAATMLPDLASLAETAVMPHPTVAQDIYA